MKLRRPERDFPERVNRILNLILVAFCLLVVRGWHLAIVQHEDRVAEAERPKRRTVWVEPQRGVILDRFGAPLAVNQEEFQVGVLYAAIRDVPRTAWVSEGGKRIRIKARSEYIRALAQMLGNELRLDAGRIEDLIHSKGALFSHLPCPIKEKLTLEEFSRLKARERDWPGLMVQVRSKRLYPAGPSMSHIVGYLGRLSGDEYRAWRNLLHLLEAAESGDPYAVLEAAEVGILPDQIASRRLEHRRLGYNPSDLVGKAGVERIFEQDLRGLCGLDQFEADTAGRRLRPLGSKLPVVSGQTLRLTLSLELQQEAERLLKEAELRATVERAPEHLGGAIVAMDPKTGEVLCLATTPSFDPNCLIEQGPELSSYLENAHWIAAVWDGVQPFSEGVRRDLGAQATASYAGGKCLDWDCFLERLIGLDHPAARAIRQMSVAEAITTLDELSPEVLAKSEVLNLRRWRPAGWPELRAHQILALDLIRLALGGADPRGRCPESWLTTSLTDWRSMQQDIQRLRRGSREGARSRFHAEKFLPWRAQNQKRWLARQRQEEKRHQRPHKPYLELLDAEEHRQFQEFWSEYEALTLDALMHRQTGPLGELEGNLSTTAQGALQRLRQRVADSAKQCGAPPSAKRECISAGSIDWLGLAPMYEQLTGRLWGHYPYLRARHNQQLKDLAAGFHPPFGAGFMRSHAFQQVAPLGSVFKLVVAAEALRQSELKHGKAQTESWTIFEDAVMEGRRIAQVGKMADGRPIPRVYQGGRLPLTAYRHFGRMDFLGALERSSNPYFSLLTVTALQSPLDLLEAAREFGFGSRTGICLSGESPGRLPHDLEHNRSGLYAFAIGQHEMRCTPLQAAVMVGAIANGGNLMKPILILGQQPQARRHIEISEVNRRLLLQGMQRVVHGVAGSARPAKVRKDNCSAALKASYEKMAPCLIGKTGTAQILETLSPDPEEGIQLVQHVWFSGIVYPDAAKASRFEQPELVVVVFLRFADGGREAAPLAARCAEFWREIRARSTDPQ
jgi:cell division protein FtsI/penicillin-binding protein 2